jgi:hypothetical protein
MGQPPPWLWDLPLINLYSVDIIGFMYDVPFVATPEVVVRRMLQLARVRPGEVLYDLGSGDGRMLQLARVRPGEVLYDLGSGDGRMDCNSRGQGVRGPGFRR